MSFWLVRRRSNQMHSQADAAKNLFSLLKNRAFLPLFLTQFFGAFNDNAFKLAMLTMVSYYLNVSAAQSERYQAIASALFILPFFLFSATAGQMADSFDKARMVRVIKVFEVVLMGIGGLSIYFGNGELMLATLTGMGIHSTFFGPIKYAILPEHLPKPQLLGATALIEASTFAAILLGTTLGTLSISGTKSGAVPAILLTGIAAIAGLTASWFIPSAPPSAHNLTIDWHVFRATHRMIRQALRHKGITIVICAISWFWLVGTIVLTKLPDYTHHTLHADSAVFAIFLALFSIGIAVGSLAINRLLAGKITLRYVPHSMLLLSLFAGDLYWASPHGGSDAPLVLAREFFSNVMHIRVAFDLFMVAFSSGLFVVPMYAYLQVASDNAARARTIAANNLFNSFFMVVGSLFVMLLLYLNVVIPAVFLILALINSGVAVLLWVILPCSHEP